jgi:hypothetical protein
VLWCSHNIILVIAVAAMTGGEGDEVHGSGHLPPPRPRLLSLQLCFGLRR